MTNDEQINNIGRVLLNRAKKVTSVLLCMLKSKI